jgi:hypothetical protein
MKLPPPVHATLTMSAVLTFMERWRPGSSGDVRAATSEQIERLAEPLPRGVASLPSVYLDFLQSMGESTGPIHLIKGTTAASALLADREDLEHPHLDQTRYFKYGVADLNEVIPLDAFLDLTKRSPDGRDAPVFDGLEGDLARNDHAPMSGCGSFSDEVRMIVFGQLALSSESPNMGDGHLYLGKDPAAPERALRLLQQAGFAFTELGASSDIIPLESAARGISVCVTSGPDRNLAGLVEFKAKTEAQATWLYELLQDHKAELSGRNPESR